MDEATIDAHVEEILAGLDPAKAAARVEFILALLAIRNNSAAAIEWAYSHLSSRLRVFQEGYERKMAPIVDNSLHLDAMRHVDGLKLSGIPELWRRHISHILWLTGGAGDMILNDAHDWVAGLSDEDMPPEVREYVCNVLAFVRRAMSERPQRKRGQPRKRERDEVIRRTVKFLELVG